MHPPKFDYYRAHSVSEAISLMQHHGQAKFLAGGHSLIPALNIRLSDPGVLIDIGSIDELKGILVTRDGGCRIGALTTHASIAASGDVPMALSEAAALIGDPQVRNRGTIGGNVAHADPASDLPTVLTALHATLEVSGPTGNRSISVDECFIDIFTTAIRDSELLESIHIRSPHPGRMFNDAAGSAYAKLPNPASHYAMVGAAAVISVRDGHCDTASVAVGGLTPTARRAHAVEAALVGQMINDANLEQAAGAVQDDLGDEILDDFHASAAYRRAMAPLFVKQALEKAVLRA
jgi:carbon-monoxide dehydrogenase medium subunit